MQNPIPRRTDDRAAAPRENITIQELLDNDRLVSDFRTSLFVQRAISEEKLAEALEYVIKEPTNPDDKKESYKYPLSASQLLSVDTRVISDFFCKTDTGTPSYPNLRKLLGFLETPELNYVLAGYFHKITNQLIQSRPLELFELLFSKEEKFLGLLIDKMYCKSITGVLNFILNCRLDYRLIAQSLREQRIEGFEKVFSIMLESAGDQDKIEYHLSAVSILTELLQNYEAVFDGKAIVKEVILKQSQFELLISQLSANVNASDKTKKSLGNLPNIIHLAFEFARKNILECQDFVNWSMGPLISVIKLAVEQLGQKKDITFVGASTTFGNQNNTLGRKNLQLLEILDDIIRINAEEANRMVAEAGFYHLVPSVLVNHPWHSVMHNLITQQLITVLTSLDYGKLVDELFTSKENILHIFAQAFADGYIPIGVDRTFPEVDDPEELAARQGEKISFTKGYMAHLVQLTAVIESCAQPIVIEATQTDPVWTEHMKLYAKWRRREDFNLGGVQIRERTAQENFDFSVEDIHARYLDFLAPLRSPPAEHGQPDDENAHPQKSGNSGQDQDNEVERSDNADNTATEGGPDFDEFISSTINHTRNRNGLHASGISVSDDISAEYNDSNFWQEAHIPKNSVKLDQLLQELD